jgi:hypothetical protein
MYRKKKQKRLTIRRPRLVSQMISFNQETAPLLRDHITKYKRRWTAVTVLAVRRFLLQWRKEGLL